MMCIGCSEHHTDFAGSLSVTHEHFLKLLTDIASCIVKYGFKNIVTFNSHGGNQAIGQTFIESFGYRNPSLRLAMITWWRVVIDQLMRLNESGKGGAGHAGECETSLMLLIAPELVHLDQIKPMSNVPTFDWAEGDMLSGAKASLYRTMKEMTGQGVFGDPSYGSKEKGKIVSDIVTKELTNIPEEIILILLSLILYYICNRTMIAIVVNNLQTEYFFEFFSPSKFLIGTKGAIVGVVTCDIISIIE